MSNKVSDCCGYESAESDLHGVYCLKCGKPCGVKSASGRLLTDEEITEVTIWCNHPAEIPKAIAKAQDAKTYPLAFEAGRESGEQNIIEAHEDIRRKEQDIKDLASGLITFADLGIKSDLENKTLLEAQKEITKLKSEHKIAIAEIAGESDDGKIRRSYYNAGIIDGQTTNHKRHGKQFRDYEAKIKELEAQAEKDRAEIAELKAKLQKVEIELKENGHIDIEFWNSISG